MQCNDYFYSRYFGSPFALSGMTPHWPTDYLCGCCHTWLLQRFSHSTIILSCFYCNAFPPFLSPPLSSHLRPSSQLTSELRLHFLRSICPLQHFCLLCLWVCVHAGNLPRPPEIIAKTSTCLLNHLHSFAPPTLTAKARNSLQHPRVWGICRGLHACSTQHQHVSSSMYICR